MPDDIVEKSPGDAPAWLNADEANGWANGYNAAVREARAEILRLREQAGRAVGVKAIDWRDLTYQGVEEWVGHCALSTSFTIRDEGSWPEYRFVVRPFMSGRTSFPTADEAKAAAQADYETRIRSALVDAPAAAMAGGWKLVPPMATPKMLHAADSRFAFDQDHYAALLAAAPSPPPVEPVAPFDPVAFMQDDSGLPCRFDPPVEKGEVAVAVAAEREACAQVVRRVRDTWIKGDASSAIGNAFQRACDQALDGILGRARGEAG